MATRPRPSGASSRSEKPPKPSAPEDSAQPPRQRRLSTARSGSSSVLSVSRKQPTSIASAAAPPVGFNSIGVSSIDVTSREAKKAARHDGISRRADSRAGFHAGGRRRGARGGGRAARRGPPRRTRPALPPHTGRASRREKVG